MYHSIQNIDCVLETAQKTINTDDYISTSMSLPKSCTVPIDTTKINISKFAICMMHGMNKNAQKKDPNVQNISTTEK